jgi:serine/threonine protein kinase
MWALGIVLYKMAVAYKPTQIGNYKYGSGPIPFRKTDWKKKSPELQDLIVKMLQIDPAERISASEALKHPWFKDGKHAS